MPSKPAAAPAATAPRPPLLLVRFSATERWLHWIHTAGFLGMLATGLMLYLPGLTGLLGSRPTLKAAHLVIVAAWITALLLMLILGNRPALRSALREIDRMDHEDWQWLRRGRKAAQGRLNAGQKLHAVIQIGFAVLLLVSGTLLWLGERDHALRLAGTITVHDIATLLAVLLLVGHLWLALIWPPTRHAMRGITRGTVRADWATRHHRDWVKLATATTTATTPSPGRRPGRGAVLLAVLTAAAGTAGAIALAADATRGSRPGPGASAAPAPTAAAAQTSTSTSSSTP